MSWQPRKYPPIDRKLLEEISAMPIPQWAIGSTEQVLDEIRGGRDEDAENIDCPIGGSSK